jgi:cell division GTPase FtsZ
MNILLLSLGGGGGNILRSVKALFHHDLKISQETDPVYAERLSASVATRFLDTNQFSLVDVPPEERVLIGAHTTNHLGSRHDPAVAQRAFAESQGEIEMLLKGYSAVIVIATGGKGTGTGTIVPVTLMARELKKLVIPIFVRPSFERHEVEKRRFDQALTIGQQLDAAKIRFIEILNDRGYVDSDPQPQSVVWERMNVPIARALRGLLYVLWDLSQIDPSDLSSLFAGPGRLRVGFSEIDPVAGSDPDEAQIEEAVERCYQNPFCNFNSPSGTSLVCIQGEWSNVVDAKIKGRLSTRVTGAEPSPYNPLYARAFHMPKPWGVTTLFAEFTGNHPPIDIQWSLDEMASPPLDTAPYSARLPAETPAPAPAAAPVAAAEPQGFTSFWDLALAVNRSNPQALALAQDGEDSHITIDPSEMKKLLGTLWFRSVFPRLSQTWRERTLNVVLESAVIPNHTLRIGRRDVPLSDVQHAELKELFSKLSIPEDVRADVRFVMTVGNLWGAETLVRLRYADVPAPSRLSERLLGIR